MLEVRGEITISGSSKQASVPLLASGGDGGELLQWACVLNNPRGVTKECASGQQGGERRDEV